MRRWTPIEQDRELWAALVIALVSVCVAGCGGPFLPLVLLPVALACALVLPIVVRPRGLCSRSGSWVGS